MVVKECALLKIIFHAWPRLNCCFDGLSFVFYQALVPFGITSDFSVSDWATNIVYAGILELASTLLISNQF